MRRSEIAINEVAPVPMDYADADIQGALGYMFQRALHNEFVKRGLKKKAIAVVSQVLVDFDDPAFNKPTKPIGPQLHKKIADKRAKELGWTVRNDIGRGWRRVVPSPAPQEILELQQINLLLRSGYVVVACGGGGIPVIKNEKKYLVGVEAVIDKDLSSGLLASSLNADAFIITTDVDRVAIDFKTPKEKWLDHITLDRARELWASGHFDPGTMAPKILAMVNFLEKGGEMGVITNPENLFDALKGNSGTIFTK